MGLYDDLTWDKLTEPEQKLALCVRDGEICDFTDGGKKKFDVKDPKSWNGQKEIRGRVIAALATGKIKNGTGQEIRPTHKGFRLYGARILDHVNLSHVKMDTPLALGKCLMPSGIDISHAHFAIVILSESRIVADDEKTAIRGDGARIEGALFLRNVFIQGETRLLGADIGGTLDCGGATFENETGNAFSADGLKTGGGVFLGNATAKGETRLTGADIGGDLSCTGATFENESGDAFSADGLKTGGDVFLRNATAKGVTRLLGADIGGDLDCSGATFENESGNAFSADGLKTGGGVFLKNATAKGETRLTGADIGGDLSCTGATFENESGNAFIADGLKTGGSVFLGNATAKGVTRLPGADIGGDLDCSGATFENETGKAFNAQNAAVRGSFFWRDLKARPKGNVDWMHMRVGVLADDSKSWPERGHLILDGFEYGAISAGSLTDSKSRLRWLDLMPDNQYRPQPYRQLAKVLHQMGHETDARQIAIARMDAYRKWGGVGLLHKIWLSFIRATAGYGYEPWRVLRLIALILFVSIFFFSRVYGQGAMHPAKERVYIDACYATTAAKPCPNWHDVERRWAAPLRLPRDYPDFNSISYTIDVFFPFVDLHQEDHWEPASHTALGGFARLWMWLIIIAGWVLSTIGIAAFTGIVKDKDD